MAHTDKITARASAPSKPTILCDVGGTLLKGLTGGESNDALVGALNAAQRSGCNVQLISGGVDERSYYLDRPHLEDAGLLPDIIRGAQGKRNIESHTYNNVVAIIDDYSEDAYIRVVQEGNPGARYFAPDQVEELNAHLKSLVARREKD